MTKLFDAFISYGRPDSKEFAIKLQARLHEQGFNVWFDFNDIPLGVDFQNQINDGIEKAHHFLFLISPHAVNSSYCRKEIELAIKFNKRIIPLLHVMQISQETWQETWQRRTPDGIYLDWETCKEKGLHDSSQNMHPTIRKINWVYFQEDKGDFEKSLADLINLLRSHTDYVEQHTKFLVKALEWERHKKQTNYLLVSEEKQQAQSWLKFRFKDKQAPCIPADLHCEYITESIKNGNNLMTQVFLSYADKDRAVMEKIRNSLRRESITVWTNTTDIQTGEPFELAIKRGIEQADNLVYLLSPDSINSTYCQMELDYALSLHKRIIPLLVRDTGYVQVPSVLRELQHINLSDNSKEEDYQIDESQLLKILYEDAAYYNEHKILLTKALKWKQQQDNPSILLRGYNLQSAEAWLKLAKTRTQHPPTSLQEEFIAASQKQPPLESLDVFISYSSADSDFARKLNDTLQIQGKTTWFDQETIASGSDFQEEINLGIKACDNFLLILSPRSLSSPECQNQLQYAASLNKRCVTVLHREVETSNLHPELAEIQWIDFSNNQDFHANFNQLVRTLDTDKEHVRNHSKWLQRALEWQEKDKSDDLLLRGNEFVIAQNWLQETAQQKKNPPATDIQKEFIAASQNAIEAAKAEEERRQTEMLHLQEEKRKEAEARLAEQKKRAKLQKFFLAAMSIALVVVFFQKIQVKQAKNEAENAQIKQLVSLSQVVLLLSRENLKFDALLEAIKVDKAIEKLSNPRDVEPKTRSLVLTALQTAVYEDEDKFREQNRLTQHTGTVFDVAWSPKGETIATASGDGTVRFWNSHGQEILLPLKPFNGDEVHDVSFSPDGEIIATASKEEQKNQAEQRGTKTVILWKLNGQQFEPFKSFKISTDNQDKRNFYPVTFSSENNTIVAHIDGKTIQQTLNSNEAEALKPILNPKKPDIPESKNEKLIAKVSQSDDNALEIWNKEAKEPHQTLEGHQGSITSVKFSPNGKIIATASEDNTVRLWGYSGKKLQKLQEKYAEVLRVAGSPDGNSFASASEDGTLKIWNKESKKPKIIKGNKELILSLAWSPDGNTIASVSFSVSKDPSVSLFDSIIKLWDKKGNEINTLKQHKDIITSVVWSPNSNYIASGDFDKTIKLWDKKGNFIRDIGKHDDAIIGLDWSPDSNYIASVSSDNNIKLWDNKGNEIKIEQHEQHKDAVTSLAWSRDGNYIASGSEDKTIKLWSKEGNLLQTLKGHTGSIWSIAWSRNGNYIASGSSDNSIKLWRKEGNEFKEFKTLNGHTNDVLSVAFSPDGKTIASASKDQTVKLWDKDSGQEIQTLNGHNEVVTSVSFSPDGKTLVSADNKTIIVWNLEDLKVDKLIADACAQVKDYLRYNAPEEDKHLCDNINSTK